MGDYCSGFTDNWSNHIFNDRKKRGIMEILSLEHVCKGFGDTEVIKDLSFSVEEHSVFGFLGKNGAGKTLP
jgi:ABC-type sugar transport system ATPase subunit